MKLISEKKEFEEINLKILNIFDKSKNLPKMVFKAPYKYFSFITFDEIFMSLFFGNILNYIELLGEKSFYMAVLSPDPVDYFYYHFGYYNFFEFFIGDSYEDYMSFLNNYPKSSPADAVVYNSNIITIFSDSREWAIFASRDSDIAVCAFIDNNLKHKFDDIYGDDLLNGVNGAAKYAYENSNNIQLVKEFLENYSERF